MSKFIDGLAGDLKPRRRIVMQPAPSCSRPAIVMHSPAIVAAGPVSPHNNNCEASNARRSALAFWTNWRRGARHS